MWITGQAGCLHAQCNYFRNFVTQILETDLNEVIGSNDPFSFHETPQFDATKEMSPQHQAKEPPRAWMSSLFIWTVLPAQVASLWSCQLFERASVIESGMLSSSYMRTTH